MFQPGLYECVSPANIRREPRIVEYKLGKVFITNRVGLVPLGAQRQIHSIITDSSNRTWGRVSEADATGNAEWVCIRDINRDFMRPLTAAQPIPPAGSDYGTVVKALAAWARLQGYEGPQP